MKLNLISVGAARVTISKFYDQAMATITRLGLTLNASESSNHLVLPLIERLEKLDPINALSIARTMQLSGDFNAMVLKEISSLDIGSRFLNIANEFDSIRDDTSQLVSFMDDGKLGFTEQVAIKWMNLRRGSVTQRFQSIKTTFTDVIRTTNLQIEKENAVLAGYQQFRFAIKEAEAAAAVIMAKSYSALESARQNAQLAQDAINPQLNDLEKTSIELARDVALSDLKSEEQTYQIAKDLYENLKIAYNTSEVVFARLQQNVEMKQRIQHRSISFFSTNEIVFTALAAAFNSTQGLSESTHALEQLQAGVNKSIESLATLGTQQLEASVRVGYGSTISADSIKKLAESIVEYQQNLTTLVGQFREESTVNTNLIEQHTHQTKERFIALASEV